MGYYTYVLQCADGTLYTGWTTDLQQRLNTHNTGKGAKYTRTRRPVKLLGSWRFESKPEAMSWEWHFKRLPRENKLREIALLKAQ